LAKLNTFLNHDDSSAMPVPEVWIADDSRSMRRLLSHRVEKMGAAVRDFGTGQELIGALASVEVSPALIILNMEMPGLTGCQTGRALRRAGYTGAMALMTGSVTDAIEAEALRSGCDSVLNKSADNEQLKQLVEKACYDLSPDADIQAA
jgi:CheY-like chemotaxis protein